MKEDKVKTSKRKTRLSESLKSQFSDDVKLEEKKKKKKKHNVWKIATKNQKFALQHRYIQFSCFKNVSRVQYGGNKRPDRNAGKVGYDCNWVTAETIARKKLYRI